jgi:hypothetical protein
MPTNVRIAVFWLYLVAAATLLNSILLQLFSHFVDLFAGLWLTEANDALWVGMRSVEPPGVFPSFEIGAALVIDVLIVLVLLKLARKMSNGSRAAVIISLCVYLADTALFAYDVRVSVRSHVPVVSLAWQALTVLVHIVGILILYRAWMTLRGKSRPLAPAES